MDKVAVVGGQTLNGKVAASGAKNAALPIIFATLLAPGRYCLKNIPHLRDIDSTILLMNSLGCKAELVDHELSIDVPEMIETLAHYDLVRKMRASILVLGPLVARMGTAKVSLPGGCAIGARPINFHLEALKKMGANIEVTNGYVLASSQGLKGAHIEFPFATVGGTENLLMAASLADGTTILANAAREPEIVDLANLLRSMGAKITGDGTETITVEGVEQLKPCEHEIIADRIEVGTLLVAGALAGGEVTVTGTTASHLESFCNQLQKAGVRVDIEKHSITVSAVDGINGHNIETQPHPGFPTDLQAQYMALATQAQGESKITESVFENRFMHVPELVRMNANISVEGKTAIVVGGNQLVGAPVMATDLRASASLVLAGLVAEGETLVQRIYHLDRGYENLELKLSALGGKVRRIKG